jgi:hypothetical protein
MKNGNAVDDKILEIVKSINPETVDQLIQYLEQELKIPKKKALEHVIRLNNAGKINLSTPPAGQVTGLNGYLRSSQALWFWCVMTLALSTLISVFLIPENAYPQVYIRYILGSIFVTFLPGYSLIKVLFPTKEINNIERTTLSIGASITLVPLTGLILNYTPWGIRIIPITLSLLLLTTILAISGLFREYLSQ